MFCYLCGCARYGWEVAFSDEKSDTLIANAMDIALRIAHTIAQSIMTAVALVVVTSSRCGVAERQDFFSGSQDSAAAI